ncbi:heterokaryon incompatibility protein [Colletotrichum salicis]|uniref:Heterokaryon incompatibility protein n=1 Tax=Colletotrichum salicis TaxID=1209931 RepID=A0A135USN5_9PEZI|nr:heterokaryon incompatibility protein [Colletotrichum salicis]
MMSTFTYDEKLALTEIRLIQLLPGEWLEDLESRLYVANRDHEYQALSYTWGGSKRSNQITVNGKIHKITFNLDRALRAVRKQTEPTTFWVDSLCINQDDAAEKGQQVGLMRDIFGSATEVIAYVGDGLDRSRRDYSSRFEKLGKNPRTIFSAMSEAESRRLLAAGWNMETRTYGNTLSTEHLKLWDKWKDSRPGSLTDHEEIMCLYSLLVELSRSPLDPMASAAQSLGQTDVKPMLKEAHLPLVSERMRHFATSDWWNRMWIVQEACVARQLTVVYGRASIPFICIGNATRTFLQSPATHYSDLTKGITFLSGKADAISPAGLGLGMVGSMVDFTTNNSLLWLLRRFRNRKSSEPRDKIFALLQLAEHMKKENLFQHDKLWIGVDYEVDYEVDVGELFSHAAYEIIRDTGLLWMTTQDLLAKSRKDIPSWVPDWSSDYMVPGFDDRRHRLQEEASFKFNASRARFRQTASNSQQVATKHLLPRKHLDGLLSADVDRRKPVHCLPTMIKYTSSPPFQEERQRSALILKGVACGGIDTSSQVIRNDLSNIGQAIVQIQAIFRRQKSQHFYRKPFLEIIADCLSMSMWIPNEHQRHYVGALKPASHCQDLPGDFADTAARCPEGCEVDAISSKGVPKIWFQASTVLGDEQPWSNDLDGGESHILVRLPKDYDFQERSEANDLSWMEDTVRTMAAGNRLFITDRGQIGLGPGSMCMGDEVCVLEGGLMPYVLRKHVGTICIESSRVHQMESIMGVHRFTMVGSCYTAGIMNWGDEAGGWGDNPNDIEELDSKLRRRLNAPELAETAFLLV